MPGAAKSDLEYVRARGTLLDLLEALGRQRRGVILVGAQAVYLRVGSGMETLAPYTTDADLMITPEQVDPSPDLTATLEGAGFVATDQPGIWTSNDSVEVDLLVPEALSGLGTRGADLGVHGRRVARRARGLEAVVEDHSPMTIGSLAPRDGRTFELEVAESGALLVAKMHKIRDRAGTRRLVDKDAYDVLRLLRGVDAESLAVKLRRLSRSQFAGETTLEGLGFMEELFSSTRAEGAQMIARYVEGLADPVVESESAVVLAIELLARL